MDIGETRKIVEYEPIEIETPAEVEEVPEVENEPVPV